MVTIEEFLVWIVVGMLAGSLAGLVVKRRKEGFGRLVNLGVGMAGALIGGVLFNILKIDLGLANIVISVEDLVSAFLGSLVFLGLVVVIRKWLANRKDPMDDYE